MMLVKVVLSLALSLVLATAAVAAAPASEAYGPDPAQMLDIYRPATQGPSPILLMVHGGGWRRGDKGVERVFATKVEHWLPKGFAFVSINYRLQPEADPVQQAGDLARAVAHVQATAAGWGGDPRRIVLMGHSAGGHLVALLMADQALQSRHGLLPLSGAIILDSAAFDVPAIMAGRHFRLYDQAFGNDPAFWAKASPLHQLDRAVPPMLLVCSSRRSVSCSQATAFAGKAQTLGGDVQVLPVQMSHGEINAELGKPGPYTQRVDEFLFRALQR